jgi:hypothetical protein
MKIIIIDSQASFPYTLYWKMVNFSISSGDRLGAMSLDSRPTPLRGQALRGNDRGFEIFVIPAEAGIQVH